MLKMRALKQESQKQSINEERRYVFTSELNRAIVGGKNRIQNRIADGVESNLQSQGRLVTWTAISSSLA